MDPIERNKRLPEIEKFIEVFNKSRMRSIDKFMANNPALSTIGKYIIAFEILRAETNSLFGEEAKLQKDILASGQIDPIDLLSETLFQGDDWYFYLYNRIIEGLVGKDALPDFSNDNLTFITFNYDRSLEQYLYEALRNTFSEIEEDKITQTLKKLKILHIYGQVASLEWQDRSDCVKYKPNINESLLQRAAGNVRTIYEEQQNPELEEARNLLGQADQIFFLGFGYDSENLKVLNLPVIIPPSCSVIGTGFNLESKEIIGIRVMIIKGRRVIPNIYNNPDKVKIENMDCLRLLRNYL
jgi:hypothetical protein